MKVIRNSQFACTGHQQLRQATLPPPFTVSAISVKYYFTRKGNHHHNLMSAADIFFRFFRDLESALSWSLLSRSLRFVSTARIGHKARTIFNSSGDFRPLTLYRSLLVRHFSTKKKQANNTKRSETKYHNKSVRKKAKCIVKLR